MQVVVPRNWVWCPFVSEERVNALGACFIYLEAPGMKHVSETFPNWWFRKNESKHNDFWATFMGQKAPVIFDISMMLHGQGSFSRTFSKLFSFFENENQRHIQDGRFFLGPMDFVYDSCIIGLMGGFMAFLNQQRWSVWTVSICFTKCMPIHCWNGVNLFRNCIKGGGFK